MINTLIFIPHADDETFALHGYLQKYQLCENIKLVIFSSGHDEKNSVIRRKSCQEIVNKFHIKCNILYFKACNFSNHRDTISKVIESHIDVFKPSKILIPSGNDLHQDHKFINELCKIASKPTRHKFINEILEYCVPESEPFSETYFDTVLELNELEMTKKMDDMNKYITEYRPQVTKYEKFRTIYRRLS